jgi:hypothetical protein
MMPDCTNDGPLLVDNTVASEEYIRLAIKK